jgi:hypothetical protein
MPSSNDFLILFFRFLVIYHTIYSGSLSSVVEGLRFFAATEKTLVAPKNGFAARSLEDGFTGKGLLYFNSQSCTSGDIYPYRRMRQMALNAVITPQSDPGYQSVSSTSNTGSTDNGRSKDDPNLDTSTNDSTSDRSDTTSYRRIPLNSAAASLQKKRSLATYQPKPLGKWEFIQGNYVLRPSAFNNDPTESQPKAVLHFLGGAMIGAGK